jgi:hypothetical protein
MSKAVLIIGCSKAATDVYDGPMSRLGGGPETVAATIPRPGAE